MTTKTASGAAPAAGDEPAPPRRVEWDLGALYPDLDAWNAARARLEERVAALSGWRGRLGESAATLRDALDAVSATEKDLSRLFVFAFLQADEDRRVAAAQERRGLAAALRSRFDETVAFVPPELLRVGAGTVERFIAEEPGLSRHAFNLRDVLRHAPHTLSGEAEQVIAAAGPVAQGPERVYALLTGSDMAFPAVTLSTGETVTLDQAAYALHRASKHRGDRKLVFDRFWGAWKQYEATFGQLLDTQVKAHVFHARARRYGSALEAALAGPNVPAAVYRTLLDAASRHLPALHRYFRLRQRMLGLDDLHYYDVYPPLAASDRTFDLDESAALTLASTAPLGPRYHDLLREGLEGRWMHAYPRPGKAPGAYMFGDAYDAHPYLLLNHNGRFTDLSTFAHEWGHAIHTRLANERNPWETCGYPTFVAEIASITNELLLQEHLLGQDLGDGERLFYLGAVLEGIRGTFFRQVMFAEFELAVHEMVEAGEALSGEKMTRLYASLLRRYHGAAAGVMAIDPAYAVEWAFIPHFYGGFYVFQYATSMAAAALFAERLRAGDARARGDYLAVLSAGGSRHACELLGEYGIDLAAHAPYDALIARMDRTMDRIEAILDRRVPAAGPSGGRDASTGRRLG